MGSFNANELRKGMVYVDHGDVLLVLDYRHIKMGRTPPTNRVKIKNIVTGNITEKTYGSSDKVEDADVSKGSAQFLYADGSNINFMDTDDYSQFTLAQADYQSELGYLKEGEKVIALYIDGKAISIELPKAVELKVTQSSDAVAGDSSNNPTKKVTLETGMEINAPLFIKQGDVLRINTETGDYTGRV